MAETSVAIYSGSSSNGSDTQVSMNGNAFYGLKSNAWTCKTFTQWQALIGQDVQSKTNWIVQSSGEMPRGLFLQRNKNSPDIQPGQPPISGPGLKTGDRQCNFGAFFPPLF